MHTSPVATSYMEAYEVLPLSQKNAFCMSRLYISFVCFLSRMCSSSFKTISCIYILTSLSILCCFFYPFEIPGLWTRIARPKRGVGERPSLWDASP